MSKPTQPNFRPDESHCRKKKTSSISLWHLLLRAVAAVALLGARDDVVDAEEEDGGLDGRLVGLRGEEGFNRKMSA